MPNCEKKSGTIPDLILFQTTLKTPKDYISRNIKFIRELKHSLALSYKWNLALKDWYQAEKMKTNVVCH